MEVSQIIVEVFFLSGIGALIGWVTNVLAIKMLFRPLEPIKIPVLNIEIQGLIPKRRDEIAKSIGKTIENELISIPEIVNEFLTENTKKEIIETIKMKLLGIIDKKIPFLVPISIKSKIIEYTKEQIELEAEPLIESIVNDFKESANEKVKIGNMVEQKINDFELIKIESIIIEISKKELKHIEVLGGILGFIIGLIQALIIQII